ncbi:MAG: heme-copper oxidase subunit III, partial [Gloeomargarita sp. DG02_5_bins_242]
MTTAPTPPELAMPAASPVDDHAHHDFRLFGLLTFLVSESLMFGALFAVFLIFRAEFPAWPPEDTEVELLLPAINTVILVSSSFVIHYGDVAIKKGNVAGLQKWYGLTAVMGVIFLAGQAYEYATLGYGLTTNVFANCFYIMTGFHGL